MCMLLHACRLSQFPSNADLFCQPTSLSHEVAGILFRPVSFVLKDVPHKKALILDIVNNRYKWLSSSLYLIIILKFILSMVFILFMVIMVWIIIVIQDKQN